jgi:hypothetical protein
MRGMKKLMIFIFLTVMVLSVYGQKRKNDRGIGLRLGAPMGITYKKYLPKNKAIELGLGTVTSGWYNPYYRNTFRHLNRYEGQDYLSHRVNNVVYFQARYLLNNDIRIEGMIGRLQWYWGIGALVKFASIDYRYRDNGQDYIDQYVDLDLGPEGILGLEYTFEEVPVSLFGEFSLMVEIADRPGVFRGYSGVGARYNF